MSAEAESLADGTAKPTDADATPVEGSESGQDPKPEQKPVQNDEPTEPTSEGLGDDASPEEPAKKAPESYEFTVPDGMPDGYELDPEVTKEIAAVSRDLDLSQDEAQTLIDKVLPAWQARQVAQERALSEQWLADAKADPQFGGNKFSESMAVAKRGIAAFATDEFKALLKGPLGVHPEMIRFAWKVGQTVSEDNKPVDGKVVLGAVDSTDDAAVARKLFPKTPD